MQAEFVACYGASSHIVWLRNFNSCLKMVNSIARPLVIYCDNSIAVFYSKNNRTTGGSKHMKIKYQKVRELTK